MPLGAFHFTKMLVLFHCVLSSVLLPSFNTQTLSAADDFLGKGVNKDKSILSKYTLIGTACGIRIDSFAVIKEKFSGKQTLYRLGEHLENGIIREIKKDTVVILLNEDETIELKASIDLSDHQMEGGISPVQIDHSDVLDAIMTAEAISSQMGIRPIKSQNKGLEIVFIDQGSLFEKLGLKKGDIIYEIDGTPIENPELISAIYDQIKNFSIELSSGESDFEQQLKRYGIAASLPGFLQKAVSLREKLVIGADMSFKIKRENQVKNLELSFYNSEYGKEGLPVFQKKRPFFHTKN